MLKKLTAVLAVLLAALMLCGAALPNGWYNEDGTDVPLCFADMPYTRPDPEAMRVLADRLTDVLANAGGYRRAVELLDQMFTDYYSANTMYTIADIRSCQDLTNEYWAAEYGACMSALTQINQIMEDVYLACGASPYGERLEREYFGEGFMAEYGENAESMLSEKYVALIEQENELLMAYREAVASPTIQVNGAEVPMSDVMYDIWDEQEYNALLEDSKDVNVSDLAIKIDALTVNTKYSTVKDMMYQWVSNDAALYLQYMSNAITKNDSEAADNAIVEKDTMYNDFSLITQNIVTLGENIKGVDITEITDWSPDGYVNEQVYGSADGENKQSETDNTGTNTDADTGENKSKNSDGLDLSGILDGTSGNGTGG